MKIQVGKYSTHEYKKKEYIKGIKNRLDLFLQSEIWHFLASLKIYFHAI